MLDSPFARLASALAVPNTKEWTIDGPLDGKIVILRHQGDTAIQVDRGQRQKGACRLFVEVETLHSGQGRGGFRQTMPEVIRTWIPFGHLPLPAKVASDADGMRDTIVTALDHAIGASANRRLQAIRARLALDITPFRDGTPDPQDLGWHLSTETQEIYAHRRTLTLPAEGPAKEALTTALMDLYILRHGKMEPIPHIGIPEIDSAHARAEAIAAAEEGGLHLPLDLTNA